MKTFFDRLKRWLRLEDGPSMTQEDDARSEVSRRLVEMIERTQPAECTCEEAYALIDQFAEALERGEDVSALMPLVKRHLEICNDCLEEFEALLRVVQAAPADPRGA